MKKSLFILAVCSLVVSCGGRIDDSLTDKKERKLRKNATEYCKSLREYENSQAALVEAVLNNMTLEEQVCQLFIENLEGDKTFVPEKMGAFEGKSGGKAMLPGGYLFFSYNLANTPEEIMNFMILKNWAEANRKLLKQVV